MGSADDRHAITRVLDTYASALDRREWDRLAEVFTDGFWARVARELSIDLRISVALVD